MKPNNESKAMPTTARRSAGDNGVPANGNDHDHDHDKLDVTRKGTDYAKH